MQGFGRFNAKPGHVNGPRKSPVSIAHTLRGADGNNGVHLTQYAFFVALECIGKMPQGEPVHWIPCGLPALFPNLKFMVVAAQRDQRRGRMHADGVDVRGGVEAFKVNHIVAGAGENPLQDHGELVAVEP